MKESTSKIIVAQCYYGLESNSNKKSIPLLKWTPIAFTVFGIVSVALQSSEYLIILGILTFIGQI